MLKNQVIILHTKLTQTFVQKVESQGKRLTVHDEIVTGLLLRVETSGKKYYYVDYREKSGRRVAYKLGNSDLFTVAQAREAAREVLAKVALGEDPTAKTPEVFTLGELVEKHYAPWVVSNRRTGDYSLRILRNFFGHWFDKPAEAIAILDVERWRLKQTAKAASLNRRTAVLKAVLNWALKRDLIENNPLARLEQLQQTDSIEKIRYLSPDERERLMKALDDREERLRGEGNSAFVDHFKPMILLSLNTGIRQGSLFELLWSDIDFESKVLTVRSDVAKAKKVIRIPLNKVAYETLCAWKSDSELVFPSPRGGGRLNNVKKGWAAILKTANIENFRWHDMRHDFASQLVMKGVDLNTVRELLGHADIKMTLRYAHLAPNIKARAVGVLD